jgi:hypothetical protein
MRTTDLKKQTSGGSELRPSGSPTSPSESWVVHAWKQRGILSPTAKVRNHGELAELHSDSWFVRRNRHTPHTVDGTLTPRSMDDTMADSWIARRNRNTYGHSGRLASPGRAMAKPAELMRRNSTLLSAIQARLPMPQEALEPVGLEGAVSPRANHAGPEVYLTLYDLCARCLNSVAHSCGVGVYHSGIEVHGIEYTFDNHTSTGCGVVWHTPYHRVRHISLPRAPQSSSNPPICRRRHTRIAPRILGERASST